MFSHWADVITEQRVNIELSVRVSCRVRTLWCARLEPGRLTYWAIFGLLASANPCALAYVKYDATTLVHAWNRHHRGTHWCVSGPQFALCQSYLKYLVSFDWLTDSDRFTLIVWLEWSSLSLEVIVTGRLLFRWGEKCRVTERVTGERMQYVLSVPDKQCL